MQRKIRFLGTMCAIGIFAGVSSSASPAFAQLRGEKNASVLNYLGRFHGVGYSDGYHTCPDKAKCSNLQSSQAQLYAAPSSPAPLNLRPSLGIQDRWIGFQANHGMSSNYGYPSVTTNDDGSVVANPPYAAHQYALPTPAAPVQPKVLNNGPSDSLLTPPAPRGIIPEPYSPSDIKPRNLNPGDARPATEIQQPVSTGPIALPADFYNHYSGGPVVAPIYGHGYGNSYGSVQSPSAYSRPAFVPQQIDSQQVASQMLIGQPVYSGQPASNSTSRSILRQSSLAPSSY